MRTAVTAPPTARPFAKGKAARVHGCAAAAHELQSMSEGARWRAREQAGAARSSHVPRRRVRESERLKRQHDGPTRGPCLTHARWDGLA